MKKNLKIAKEKIAKPGSKGITLIALVVTIVVLLILAGITINAVLSEGGIFNTAKNAESVQQHASVKERVQVMLTDAQLEKQVNNKTLKSYLEEQGLTVNEDTTAGTLTVILDGYEVTINKATLEITNVRKFVPVAATGVTLDKQTATMSIGETLTLTPTVTPETATNKGVNWTSSVPEVATVTNGVVEALTSGTTKITVTTLDGSYTAECDITVRKQGITDEAELLAAIANGEEAIFGKDFTISATINNSYGKTALLQNNGGTIDGNGYTLSAEGANGTWDSAISTNGGTIKNLAIDGSMKTLFINKKLTSDLYIENVIIGKNSSTYGFFCDHQIGDYSVYFKDSVINGWASFAANTGEGIFSFSNCTFGWNNTYAFCRPYADTTFTNCEFEEGYTFDSTRATSTFINCKYNNQLITAENVVEFLGSNASNIVVSNTQ